MVVKSRGAMNDGGSMTSIIPKILHSFLWALKNSFNPSHTKTKYRFIQRISPYVLRLEKKSAWVFIFLHQVHIKTRVLDLGF